MSRDYNGADLLTITTNDLGFTGTGGPLSDTDTACGDHRQFGERCTDADGDGCQCDHPRTEGAGNAQGAAVAVFSAANASTVETGQTITGLTLTVGGIHDGANEKIVIDGTSANTRCQRVRHRLTNGMSFTETNTGGVATIVLSKTAGISAANADTLINGIAYQDTNVNDPTPGDRTITLTSRSRTMAEPQMAVPIPQI